MANVKQNCAFRGHQQLCGGGKYVKIEYVPIPLQSLFYQIIELFAWATCCCALWHTPNGNYLRDLIWYTDILLPSSLQQSKSPAHFLHCLGNGQDGDYVFFLPFSQSTIVSQKDSTSDPHRDPRLEGKGTSVCPCLKSVHRSWELISSATQTAIVSACPGFG